jgi:PAS domain S-box-containing protein
VTNFKNAFPYLKFLESSQASKYLEFFVMRIRIFADKIFAGSANRMHFASHACEPGDRSPEEPEMQDEDKAKEQLISELRTLRQRLAESEKDITERKRAEKALEESEERYRVLFEGSTQGILGIDFETKRFVFANPSICQMLGHTENELLDLSVEDIHPKDSLNLVLSELESQSKLASALPCLRKDGTVFFADIAGIFTSIHGRKLAVGFFSDVTERERAQEQIESIARFPNENPDPILRISGDGKLLYANRSSSALLKSLGWKQGETLTGYWWQHALQTLSSGCSKEMELICEDVVYSLMLVPVSDLGYLNIYGRDITERKKLEEKFREQADFLQTLFDTIPNPIFHKDAKGRYTGCNRAFLEFTGRPMEEILGKTVYDMGPKDIADKYEEKDRELIEHPGKQQYEWKAQNALGEVREVIFDKATLLDARAAVSGLIAVISDITERKRAENETNTQRDTLGKIFESAPYIMMLVTKDGRVTNINRKGVAFAGTPKEELLGLLCGEVFSCLNSFGSPSCGKTAECPVCQVRTCVMQTFETGQSIYDAEGRMTVRQDSKDIVVEMSISTALIKDKDAEQVLVTIADITERTKQTREIEHLNRLYSVLSRVSQAVVRATSPEKFLEQACRQVVEGGGFLLAWIGRIESMTNAVVPAAFWGGIGEYVQGITVYADSRPESIGPTGTCIREHRPVVHNDFLHDAKTLPWRDRAAPFGIASAAAFPIERAGRAWGALTIYSDGVDRFGGEDVRLLERVAGDIEFALDNLDREFRRKQTEQKAALLAAIVEYSDDAIIGKNLDGIITSCNTGAEKIYGYTESELLGKPISILLPPGYEDEAPQILGKIKSGQHIERYETVRRKKDGLDIHMSLTVSPVRNAEGIIVAASTIGRDITKRKLGEEALRESEERFSKFFHSSPVGTSISRFSDGQFVDVNDTLLGLFGYTREEVVGRTPLELKTWANAEDRAKMVKILQEQGMVKGFESQCLTKSGKIIDVLVSAEVIEVAGQQYILGLTHDISERKEAEERIRQQNERLRNANNEIESLYQRLQMDYELAAEIFSRASITDYSRFPNIRHVSLPFSIAGGDVFLVVPKPSGGMNVLLGDFTGHGLSAAIGFVPVNNIFCTMSAKGYSMNRIIAEMNSKLKDLLPTGLFFCACFLELNSTHDSLTVWNGGMPDALLVGAGGGIKQRFPSTSLPLGIVDTAQLNKNAEVVRVAEGDAVYVYSDGLIEVCNAQGEIYGQERFERSFHYKDDDVALFDQIMKDFQAFNGGCPRSDDVILAEIKCGTLGEMAETGGHRYGPKSARWKMSVELGPESLCSDPQKLLMAMLLEVEEFRNHRENIYLILAELLSNALDYGVLGLDPALRGTPEGFCKYFSLRETALETLENGCIKIDVQHISHPNEFMFLIRVEDSGPGFDHSRIDECTMTGNLTCRGRGIQLVRSVCKSLRYNKKGNRAEAVYVSECC